MKSRDLSPFGAPFAFGLLNFLLPALPLCPSSIPTSLLSSLSSPSAVSPLSIWKTSSLYDSSSLTTSLLSRWWCWTYFSESSKIYIQIYRVGPAVSQRRMWSERRIGLSKLISGYSIHENTYSLPWPYPSLSPDEVKWNHFYHNQTHYRLDHQGESNQKHQYTQHCSWIVKRNK